MLIICICLQIRRYSTLDDWQNRHVDKRIFPSLDSEYVKPTHAPTSSDQGGTGGSTGGIEGGISVVRWIPLGSPASLPTRPASVVVLYVMATKFPDSLINQE